jgi:Transposase IS66 family
MVFFVFVSSSSLAGGSPVRVAARRPGSRLAVSSGNGRGRSPASKALNDAWAPYDCYDCGGHALCCAHVLRELAAVTETGTDLDVTWARQAADALLALKKAADEARADGLRATSEETLREHSRWFREAASAGVALNTARRTALQKKRHALAARDGRPRGGLPPLRL